MATFAYIVIIGWFVVNMIVGLTNIGKEVEITGGGMVLNLFMYIIMTVLLFQI